MNWHRQPTLNSFLAGAWRPSLECRLLATLVMIFLVGAGSLVGEPAPNTDGLLDMDISKLMTIPVVTAASGHEQKTTEAPSSVTILTAEDVKRYGYRTLADILQSVQGFQISYDRNYAFLGARGINLGDFNSRILLLINGHRANNNLTDGALIDTAFPLDVDLIDRVEIIRGPGSVLYGNNAFFGVVNVITKDARAVNGGEASGEYGSYDSYKARGTFGQHFTNGVSLLISGSYYENPGPDHLYFPAYNKPPNNPNNGIANKLDDDAYGSFFGSLQYQDFTLEGAFVSRDKQNPTAYFATTFNDPRLRTLDERSYVTAKYAHKFEDFADVTAQVYYDRSDFEINYPYVPTLYREQQAGEWWGAEVQLIKHLGDAHTITFGAEYRDDFRQHLFVSEPSTGAVFTDADRTRQSHGIYLQGEFTLVTNRLHLSAGARYDQYGSFDPAFNPRVALIYNPYRTATIKAIYGTAFRDPNFLELSDPRFQNIQPEEITSYELVYEQQLAPGLRSSVSGYFNEMNDLIVFNGGYFTNFDADAKGLEFALEGIWTNQWRARLSYAVQETKDRSFHGNLADSPEQLFKLNVSVPVFRDKIFAGLEYQYTTSRHTVLADRITEGDVARGFGVLNLTVFSRDLVKNLEFSASVYNLLDQDYGDPASRFHLQDILPRDGRSFRLKLTYRF